MDITAYQHMNIRMSTRGKRPLRNLTPSDKVRAIQRIHNGETKASVSRDIGVPESTLRGWCKNEQKLRFMCRQLGAEQQLPAMPGMENPPEKRLKFEAGHSEPPKFPNTVGFEDFAYSRLPLMSGMDFGASSINANVGNGNAILDRITLNEFLKNNHLHQPEDGKPPSGNNANLQDFSSLPGTADCSQQFAMVHNLNLLSLLNPNLTALSGFSAASFDGSNKTKAPLRAPNVIAELAKDNVKTNNAHALVVKNGARDPAENPLIKNHININNNNNNNTNNNNCKRELNDTNNNDVKSKNYLLSQSAFPEAANYSSIFSAGVSLPPLALAQMTNSSADAESSNASLLEWCKVFNASLNFLALAAAAAALQPAMPSVRVHDPSDESSISKAAQELSAENLLYKQLTRTAHRSANTPVNATHMHSDVSNDSYFDSEPEDLSIRSATSKVSSPANSRSQSPHKSTATSSESAPSDADQ